VAGQDAGLIPAKLLFPGLPFFATYRVREDVVEINRVLHGAQRY
jgi:hypothetical protein